MDSEEFKHLLTLSGIGAKKAEALYNAGFRSIDDIRNASLEDLMRVPGIGEKLARRIKEAFEEKTEEDDLKLYLCPNCGAFVSEDDKVCPKCGMPLDGEEELETDEETKEIKAQLETKDERADGYWYKKDEHKLVICPECGAFIPEDAKECPKCGTIFEGEEEIEPEKEVESEEGAIEADGHWYKESSPTLYLCPNCGAFVSEDDKVCPKCGMPLDGEEELEKAPETSEMEEHLVDREKADGYWYKKDEHKLAICPECGAFIPEDAKECPKCGTIFEGEEEIKAPEITESAEADGFWYRKGEQDLMMCPECGAFIPKDADVCPKCGAVFAEEAESQKKEALPEIPADKILEMSRVGREEEKEEREKIPDIEEILGEFEEGADEESEEEEEVEEEEEKEEKRRRSLELGEELGNIFETPVEKTGVSKEFASRWESLFSNKPYGPESAYEENKEKDEEIPATEKEGEEEKEREEERESKKSRGISGVRYRKKGLTNGLTNGKGYRNGEIRISRTNGRTNGMRKNGRTNGLTNGFINVGIVNGNGFMNGGEGLRDSIEEERPLRRGLVPITILLAILILTPLLMSFLIAPVPKEIRIGGGFGEWQDIIEYPDSITDQMYDRNINFEALKVYEDWGGISFYARMVEGGRLFDTGENGVSSILIFIDADSNASTGYYLKGIGADYMIEMDGWNGTAHYHQLYSWNSSRSQDDWNGWVSERSVPVYNNQREIETKVYLGNLRNPRVIFASRDYFGNEDFSDVIISLHRGALRVDEYSIGPAIAHRGQETQMLRLDMRSYGAQVSVDSMSFGSIGNNTVSSIMVYRDNGNGIFDGGDTLIGTPSNGMVSLSEALQVPTDGNITLFVTAIPSSTARDGESVSIYLSSVSISQGAVTIVPHLTGGSYIERIPSNPVIDGSFHDWDNILKNPDAAGDVIPSDNPNIDISQYAVWPHDGLSFYVNVDGNMLGGEDMPFTKHRPRPILDHDHDGIPDSQDQYPYDFNNDGIPDNESYVIVNGRRLKDVDGDGIPDYPYGPDKWLNNTQTGAHIYIGPVHLPVKTGYDYVMLFVDIDGNMSTGYRAPWLPIGADYLIEVEGRDMRINSSWLMRFTGNSQNIWNWSVVENSEAAIGEHEIECKALLNTTADSEFFVYTTDWEHNRDLGEGSTGGTRAVSSTDSPESASVTKTLHLRSGDVLNTSAGNSEQEITINDGDSHSWIQSPVFAKDFHVESAIVYLYVGALDNFPASPTIYVYLEDNGTEMASASKTISSTGWVSFDMGTIDHTIRAGNRTDLVVDVPNTLGRTSVTLFYNSSDYDSRIDMETDTYINVDYVRTYNGTDETDTFYPGDTVNVLASISDPFGSYDISGATVTITDPNGTVLVSDEYMNISSSNESSILFSYNYTLPLNASSGEYQVEVTGIESNGVTSTGTASFIVPAHLGVVIGPDSTSTGSSDSFVSYELALKNIGEVADTYEITAGISSQYWRTELWYNGSEVAYDSDGDGTWDWVNASYDNDSDGVPEFNLSSLESINLTVRKFVPPSSDGLSDITYIYATSETDNNISDSAKLTTNIPSNSPTKSLHLHSGDGMDTFTGSSATSTRISNGETHTWIQSDAFYTDFNITSYVTVYLYISPTAATGWWSEGAPDVEVSLYYNGTSIGSDTITDLTKDGWYEFTIPVMDTVHILKGERIGLNVSVSSAGAGFFGTDGYIDLYYNSQDYDSRIVMPTDTYVDVEDIRTYNATEETQIFQQGENVHIVSNISDPFGYGDIAGANITILDPDGNVIIHDDAMDLVSGSGANATFSYDFQTNNTSEPGQYTIYVTGIESNGVTDTMEGNFIIPPEYGVSVYPDQTKTGGPNEEVDFVFTVQNIGNTNDTYDISLSPSTYGWRSEIWNGSDEVAYDSDGDGVIDWINPSYDPDRDGLPEFSLSSFEKMNLTLKRFVPEDAGSVSDTVKLIATSETNSTVHDGAKATINCPLAYPTKTFHLHSDGSMDTFQGNSTATIQISNGDSATWTQSPVFAEDFNITSSYIPVYLYIEPTAATGWRNQGNPDVTVQVSYDGGTIGSDTISDMSGDGWYIFSIPVSSNITIPAGDALSINISVSSAGGGIGGSDGYITLRYDSSTYDARMEMSTNTVVNVDSVKTYNGSTETSIFSAGDTVTIRSLVSDPIGAQDIAGAEITITSPDGKVLVGGDSMDVESTDTSNPPAWNSYVYNYILPSDAKVGEYQIKVKGIESNGVVDYMETSFTVPCGVSVSPNHTTNATSPSTVSFNHTITNTGKGADVYDITLISQNGYNVSLYTQSGVLMGYDSNGDGVWDYVNPDYDLNKNGVPDTGILLPGQSVDVIVKVEIPSNVTGWENVTVSAESFFGSCQDSAFDSIYVPEFQNIIPVLIISMVLPMVIIKRKKSVK